MFDSIKRNWMGSALLGLVVLATLSCNTLSLFKPTPTAEIREVTRIVEVPAEPAIIEVTPIIETPEVEYPPIPEVFRVGFVTDTSGIDDRSFNTTQWAGIQRAVMDFDIVEV